jgi:hypothetical protein
MVLPFAPVRIHCSTAVPIRAATRSVAYGLALAVVQVVAALGGVGRRAWRDRVRW